MIGEPGHWEKMAELGEGFVSVIKMTDGDLKGLEHAEAWENCLDAGMTEASTFDLYMSAIERERFRREGWSPTQIRVMNGDAAAEREVESLVAAIAMQQAGLSFGEICHRFGGEFMLGVAIGEDNLASLRNKEK